MLTPKQWQVIPLVAQGLSNRDIGQRVGITPNVARNILRDIYDRMGFSNRLELALWYTKYEHDHGILRSDA